MVSQIYSEFRLPQYPSLTPQITAFAQSKGKDHDPVNSLGSYFERPGRTMLESHLLDVPSCESVLEKIKGGKSLKESRVYFAGESRGVWFLKPLFLGAVARS
jgi:hypothetical protein